MAFCLSICFILWARNFGVKTWVIDPYFGGERVLERGSSPETELDLERERILFILDYILSEDFDSLDILSGVDSLGNFVNCDFSAYSFIFSCSKCSVNTESQNFSDFLLPSLRLCNLSSVVICFFFSSSYCFLSLSWLVNCESLWPLLVSSLIWINGSLFAYDSRLRCLSRPTYEKWTVLCFWSLVLILALSRFSPISFEYGDVPLSPIAASRSSLEQWWNMMLDVAFCSFCFFLIILEMNSGTYSL